MLYRSYGYTICALIVVFVLILVNLKSKDDVSNWKPVITVSAKYLISVEKAFVKFKDSNRVYSENPFRIFGAIDLKNIKVGNEYFKIDNTSPINFYPITIIYLDKYSIEYTSNGVVIKESTPIIGVDSLSVASSTENFWISNSFIINDIDLINNGRYWHEYLNRKDTI